MSELTEPQTRALRREIGLKLDLVGFYATANDLRRGRIGTAEASYRLRRDAPKRVQENAEEAIALAEELDRGREVLADA